MTRIWLAPSAFFPHRGGVEELTLQLARAYQARGHEVLVVAPRHPKELPTREVIHGVHVRRVAFSAPRRALWPLIRYPFSLAVQVATLLWLARGRRPDLVHVQCPSAQLVAVTIAAKALRAPLVLTSQGEVVMDANGLYQRSVFMRVALRWASARAAALTACSTWTAAQAARIAPRFSSATVVLNGVDPDQWSVAAGPGEPVICAWGRHVPQKGLDLLIRAFVDVRRRVPGARLLIGGSGDDTPALAALASDGVELVGPLDRDGVQALLHRSHAAAVPSRLEPFGIVATEAMACGRAVVWSTNGGLSEATGGHGWGVDPTDESALADAMVHALSEEPDRAVLRRHAEQLSWARLADVYLGIYRRVLGSP